MLYRHAGWASALAWVMCGTVWDRNEVNELTTIYHVLTPGDHYSPRTGSALPTVVHGLAKAALSLGAEAQFRQKVVVAAGTYEPRYESAEPLLYAPSPAPARHRRYLDMALGRVGLPRHASAAYFAPIAERIEREEPGVVLAHNAPLLPWLLRGSRHRVIVYAHNDLLRSYGRIEASRSLRNMSQLICVSQALASQLALTLPASMRDRIRVVPNGVDTQQFRPVSEREAGPLRVMFLGRAIPQKGADILLAAAVKLQRSDIHYLIIGSHEFNRSAALSKYEQRLRRLAAETVSRVDFEPFVDRTRLPALLQRADIIVVPSRWAEPSGLTVGEGLATGVPVIAAASGGIPEVLGDAGILFDPGRPDELAHAIQRLADDPDSRRELGLAARSRAEQHDWSWSWQQLRDLLEQE